MNAITQSFLVCIMLARAVQLFGLRRLSILHSFDSFATKMVGVYSILEVTVTLCLAAVFGFIPLVKFIVDIVRKGPSRMLCSRLRNVRPEVLKSSEYGTHQFVRLPVS